MAFSYVFAFYLFDKNDDVVTPEIPPEIPLEKPQVEEKKRRKLPFLNVEKKLVSKIELPTVTESPVIKKSKNIKQRVLHKELFEDHQEQVIFST